MNTRLESLTPTPDQFRDPQQFQELRRRALACRGVGTKKWNEFLARHGYREEIVAVPLPAGPPAPEPAPEPVLGANWRCA